MPVTHINIRNLAFYLIKKVAFIEAFSFKSPVFYRQAPVKLYEQKISQGLFLSEQFQLLCGSGERIGFSAPEIYDFTVLLVGNSQDAHLPF